MMRSISLENLPAVVKDAINVCRRYGIQYLWVDAFCMFVSSVILLPQYRVVD
jgi:hypothetical protein